MVIFVDVNASATREKPHCPIPAQNATVAGIPATYLPIIENGRDAYIFATMGAGYQLSYRATLYGRSETATGSDQAIYARFITSFKPIPAIPFHC